eukprot:UN04086
MCHVKYYSQQQSIILKHIIIITYVHTYTDVCRLSILLSLSMVKLKHQVLTFSLLCSLLLLVVLMKYHFYFYFFHFYFLSSTTTNNSSQI